MRFWYLSEHPSQDFNPLEMRSNYWRQSSPRSRHPWRLMQPPSLDLCFAFMLWGMGPTHIDKATHPSDTLPLAILPSSGTVLVCSGSALCCLRSVCHCSDNTSLAPLAPESNDFPSCEAYGQGEHHLSMYCRLTSALMALASSFLAFIHGQFAKADDPSIFFT